MPDTDSPIVETPEAEQPKNKGGRPRKRDMDELMDKAEHTDEQLAKLKEMAEMVEMPCGHLNQPNAKFCGECGIGVKGEEELEFTPTDHMIVAEKGPPKPVHEEEEEILSFDRLRTDGRRSGGQFGLYRYEIVDQVTKQSRTLRAPLVLAPKDLPLTKYETIPSKKRTQEFYDNEGERDEVLACQFDPRTGKSYGWGPYDPARRHPVMAGNKRIYVGNDEREQQ